MFLGFSLLYFSKYSQNETKYMNRSSLDVSIVFGEAGVLRIGVAPRLRLSRDTGHVGVPDGSGEEEAGYRWLVRSHDCLLPLWL